MNSNPPKTVPSLNPRAPNPRAPNPRAPNPRGVILRAGAIVSCITLLSRILGLVRDSLIAVLFGAGPMTDAFFIALRVPNLFRRMVAEGSLATAAVPLFTKARERSTDEFRKSLGAIILLSLATTLPLAIFSWGYARELVLLLSPGLGTQESLVQTATKLIEILIPFIVIVSITAVLASALNAVHRYALAALPSVITNLAMIFALVYFFLRGTHPIQSLAWAFLIGSIIAVLPLLFQLWSLGLTPKSTAVDTKRNMRRFFPIFAPALFAASAHQLLSIILSLLASMLPVGTISHLYYADRIYQFPLGIFSVALATAALPRLAELRADEEQFGKELTHLLCWITLGALPATVGLATLAGPIVRLLYEHGNFEPKSAWETSTALIGYVFGLWPISLQVILVRAYLARGYTRVPALSTVVAVVVTPIVALMLMGPPSSNAANVLALSILTFQGRIGFFNLGQQGLALSGGIGMAVAVIILFMALKRIGVNIDFKEFFIKSIQGALACFGMWLVLRFFAGQIANLTALVIISVPVGAAVYAVLAVVLGAVQWGEIKKGLSKIK